jgi:hypothetical protein
MASCRADLFNVIGSTATFTTALGTVSTPTVIIRESVEFYPGDMITQAREQISTVRYIYSEIGREANRGETFEQNGVTYTCKYPINNDGKTVTMAVKK